MKPVWTSWDVLKSCYIWSIITCPNPEQDTCEAPGISRAKSYVTRLLAIDFSIELTHIRNFGAHHFQQQAERRLIGEGHAPGQHFEQHDAE